jgi:hypothetical protein
MARRRRSSEHRLGGVLRRVAALAGCALLGVALAACSGPSSSAQQSPSAAVQPPAVTPTRASDALESPLPPAGHQPALTTAAATGTGSFAVQDEHPGLGCLSYTWQARRGAPALKNGLAFAVTGIRVDPPLWRAATAGCGGSVAHPCIGGLLTYVRPDCQQPLARPGGPDATGTADSSVKLVGHLVCSAPVTAQECAGAMADLAATGGDSIELSGSPGATSESPEATSTAKPVPPPAPVPAPTSGPKSTDG